MYRRTECEAMPEMYAEHMHVLGLASKCFRDIVP